jgi:hypothetical protein
MNGYITLSRHDVDPEKTNVIRVMTNLFVESAGTTLEL